MSNRNRNRIVLAASIAALSLQGVALAASITRNNTTFALNDPAAWTGGVAPADGDIAVWNSTSTTGNQSLGGPVSWGGILISAGAAASSTITDPGAATLSIGSLGIALNNAAAATNRGLTINPAIVLAADQTWLLGSGNAANIVTGTAASISGPGRLSVAASTAIPAPLGTLTLGSASSTFSGGFAMGPNSIVNASGPTTISFQSGGVLTSSVFGTGSMAINGGRLNLGQRSLFNPLINIGGDFILQTSGTRIDITGVLDMQGATRTISLTRGVNAGSIVIGGGGNALRFATLTGGTTTTTHRNGALRLVADPSVAAGSFVGVNVPANQVFQNNNGLIIGDRVVMTFGSSFGWSFANAPAMTVEAGGRMSLSDNTANRNITVHSLAGSGTVLNLASSGTASLLSINSLNAVGSTEFSGIIADTDTTTFPTASATNTISVRKTGDSTQVLSGNNTYTGATTIAGGVLAVSSLGNGGVASGVGASDASASNVRLNGGTLRYTGAGAATDRQFTVNSTGGTVDASGTGPLTFAATTAVSVSDPADRPSTGTAGLSTLDVDASDLVAGMSVTGTHVAAGTTIVSVDRYNGIITLSQPLLTTVSQNATSFSTVDRTFTLSGSNPGNNTLAGSLGNTPLGAKLSVVKNGAGQWALTNTANTFTGGLTVNSGTLVVANTVNNGTVAVNGTGTLRISQKPTAGDASGTSRTSSLEIAGGVTPTATLDLTNNGLVLDYTGSSPLAATTALIAAGRTAGGTWTGPGLTSSTAAASPSAFAVGIGEASNVLGPSGGTFLGQTVDASTVLVRFTRLGDANLDGGTDIGDFSRLAANFNVAGQGWTGGDFNYDGNTGIGDFSLLAANFNQSVGSLPRGAVVPEPAAVGLAGITLLAALRRRR